MPPSTPGDGCSPPAKRAKADDFSSAVMRSMSVECYNERSFDSQKSDVSKGDSKATVMSVFDHLGKMPTEKIINDR